MRDLISKVATWAIMSLIVISTSNLVIAEEVGKIRPEVMCLAKNIYYEAGNESFDGKVAVAQVTLNRVEHEQFPDEVCGVVYQKTRRADNKKIVCQFSWVCEAGRVSIRYHSDRWRESLNVARDAIDQGLRLDELEEALFYHNIHVRPGWGLEKITKIGGHIFYNEQRIKKR